MAFIRRNMVHGHKYYNAVRNYRDREGKHRQEVLCYLGVHSSLEAAIDAERKKVKIHRERASLHRKRAKTLRAMILERHGWELVNGEIPSAAEAARQRDFWYEQWDALFHPDYRITQYTENEEEEVDLQIDKYVSFISYHLDIYDAGMADDQANAHQEKLEKLLRVKREYF